MSRLHALLLPVAITAAVPTAAIAQTAQPEAMAERFLQTLKAGQVDAALRDIGSSSKLLAKKLEADATVATQINLALTGYGPINSWERIKTETLGTMVRRDTYLVQQGEMVTRWRFVYLRTGTGWITGFFVFEDQAPTWFE